MQIGESLVGLRRWAEAEQAFRRALAIDLLDPHARLGLAKTCLRQQRVEEGVAAALESVRCLYQNPMAHYILGLGLVRMKQYLRAVEAVRVAVALNPNFERAHRFLARYALRAELDAEKSREHLQMLAAGSLPVLTDGRREADGDNPRGYFELDAATRLRQDRDWVRDAKGKAVKMVAQLLPFLPPDLPYRVVFMDRDLSEILASQKVMLENLGRTQARLSDGHLEQAFGRQLKQVRVWLARQPNIKTLFVSHREAIADPRAVALKVNAFLGGGLDVQAMAAAVDGVLYRRRASAR